MFRRSIPRRDHGSARAARDAAQASCRVGAADAPPVMRAMEVLESRQLLSASVASTSALTDVVAHPNVTVTPSANYSSASGYTPDQIAKAYGFDKINYG